MKNITMTRKIKTCNFTPEQWQLFTRRMDCQHVADEFNEYLTYTVNLGADRQEVRSKMQAFMAMYSEYGAADSEPMYFLEEVLDVIFDAD